MSSEDVGSKSDRRWLITSKQKERNVFKIYEMKDMIHWNN